MDNKNDVTSVPQEVSLPYKLDMEEGKVLENGVESRGGGRLAPLKAVYGEYAESTTIHGIAPIYLAKNMFMRIFWMLIFASAFGLMSWQLWRLIEKLQKNDVLTLIRTRYADSIQFPSVSFCNVRALVSTVGPAEFKRRVKSKNYTEDELFRYGIKEEDFLLKDKAMCFFANKPCNFTKHFSHFISDEFGNCFTFSERDPYQRSYGADAFSIVLNISTDGYYQSEASRFSYPGIVLVVHSQGEVVTDELFKSKAIFIEPGKLARISITKREMKRLPSPYPDRCYEKKLTDSLLGLSLKSHFKYTIEFCLNLCQLRRERGCQIDSINRNLEELRFLSKHGNVVSSAKTEANCSNELCDCPPPCEQDIFKHETTMEGAFSAQRKHLLYALQSASPNDTNLTMDDASRNILQVVAYISDFTVETIEQTPAYDTNSFLSDLGGQLGLWIGASVYSGFELVSIVFNIFHNYLVKKRGKKNSSDLK